VSALAVVEMAELQRIQEPLARLHLVVTVGVAVEVPAGRLTALLMAALLVALVLLVMEVQRQKMVMVVVAVVLMD
jgi:hypothetical protein